MTLFDLNSLVIDLNVALLSVKSRKFKLTTVEDFLHHQVYINRHIISESKVNLELIWQKSCIR
jgi:hypothetical protein